ncbi:MAG TPA: exodeoxyribonuclease V subunit alpha [Acidimicrobiales bacterium]|nr:exodeoxyribonuclease V subunit alpha [Acidimicrobiales bacterium]
MSAVEGVDVFDALVARGSVGRLQLFNAAGILTPSDFHVARCLSELGGVSDEAIQLAAAFAARAPRLGHVCVDLRTIRHTASSDTDRDVEVDELPWPEPDQWLRVLAGSGLVGEDRPLHLEGSNLYLNRQWLDEVAVGRDLLRRAEAPAPGVDAALLAEGLGSLFREDPGDEDPDHLQPVAAATAVLRRLSVIAGGPGTGKTTTVARVLALLDAQAAATGGGPPLVALAAPTGKAAARLEEAVRAEAEGLEIDGAARARLQALRGTTIHRLLGFDPGNRTRFRHHAGNPLRHDAVVVDETSMVSLSMMARLLEAVGPEARLVLVGDPEQLASVEAGAVLGDVVGPAAAGMCMGEAARERVATVTGRPVPPSAAARPSAIGDGVVALRYVRRHGGGIAELARAIQRGDADGALGVLAAGGSNVQWIPAATGEAAASDLRVIRTLAIENGRAAIEAARAGDAEAALDALGRFRLLCAHRRGPEGVTTWTRQIEAWLMADVEGFSTGADWYVGRPLIVTENDHALQLFNGDVGVVVRGVDRPMVAAFERGGEVVTVSPTRLAAIDTVYAMTVHKSQGSQFHTVALLLPGAGSRLLTRELLYTAVTRAQERLIVVGGEEPIRAAVERPISRASGLRRALWGNGG